MTHIEKEDDATIVFVGIEEPKAIEEVLKPMLDHHSFSNDY